ncbi:hypothetical protein EDB84DRAFT_1442413 [Lactarius hengduanensis]|nr:hypothetical protein EDB84DRAFT_1442413 [Lactarius hengduanensis]
MGSEQESSLFSIIPAYYLEAVTLSRFQDTELLARLHAVDWTPLHRASYEGLPEVARLLLSYGANVDERDGNGRTPFQEALSKGHDEMTKLPLEHGAVGRGSVLAYAFTLRYRHREIYQYQKPL